jgi:hypothetical protein
MARKLNALFKTNAFGVAKLVAEPSDQQVKAIARAIAGLTTAATPPPGGLATPRPASAHPALNTAAEAAEKATPTPPTAGL